MNLHYYIKLTIWMNTVERLSMIMCILNKYHDMYILIYSTG